MTPNAGEPGRIESDPDDSSRLDSKPRFLTLKAMVRSYLEECELEVADRDDRTAPLDPDDAPWPESDPNRDDKMAVLLGMEAGLRRVYLEESASDESMPHFGQYFGLILENMQDQDPQVTDHDVKHVLQSMFDSGEIRPVTPSGRNLPAEEARRILSLKDGITWCVVRLADLRCVERQTENGPAAETHHDRQDLESRLAIERARADAATTRADTAMARAATVGTEAAKVLANALEINATRAAAGERANATEPDAARAMAPTDEGAKPGNAAAVRTDADTPTRDKDAARSGRNAISELEQTTPPLDRNDGSWVSAKIAAKGEGVASRTLARYRSDGIANSDLTLGKDAYGRIWRRPGTSHTHPWYLLSSLSTAPPQDTKTHWQGPGNKKTAKKP